MFPQFIAIRDFLRERDPENARRGERARTKVRYPLGQLRIEKITMCFQWILSSLVHDDNPKERENRAALSPDCHCRYKKKAWPVFSFTFNLATAIETSFFFSLLFFYFPPFRLFFRGSFRRKDTLTRDGGSSSTIPWIRLLTNARKHRSIDLRTEFR